MWLLLLACARPLPEVRPYAPAHAVAFRPVREATLAGRAVREDAGLRAAAEELAAGATRPDARLAPAAVRAALGRAGYPADAHFLLADGGEVLPPALVEALPTSGTVDLGLAWRDLGEGRRRWVVGYAERRLEMDPLPRDVPLDGGVALRVDGARAPRLWLGHPDGRAEELGIQDGTSRWIDRFHLPGEYRVEVVDGDRVELLFSLYVDVPPPAPAPLPGPAPLPDPVEAAEALLARVAALRTRTGAGPVQTFAPYAGVARAHALCLAAVARVAHADPSCPGVPAMAAAGFWPRARHYEDVAAGDTVAELWERMLDSPAHRANLLCPPCTHVAIGTAVDGQAPPRLWAVVNLLEFPEGEPMPIERPR